MNEKLTKILDENNVKYRYDGGWGAYHIYDEYETVCKNEEELEEYIESILGIAIEPEECWDCGETIEEFCYSPTAYYKDGTKENIEDLINGMTEEDMENYEKEIKKEYDNVDYVDFGEFCPHCLACI